MPTNKLLSMLDASEPIKENKPIRDIEKENFNNDKTLKSISNLFRVEEKESINDKAWKDISSLYGLEKKGHK